MYLVDSHEFGKMSSIEMGLGNFPHDIDRTLFDPWLIFMALFFSAFKRGDSEIWYSQSPFLQNTEVL